MEEIRKNHIVKIKLSDNKSIDGVVEDYTPDRIMVMVSPVSIESAKVLKELDEITVFAHTHMGIKKMNSSVMSPLNSDNSLLIENCPSEPVVQKRAFVRVLSSINFSIIKDDVEIPCICINISAGGIAFYSNYGIFYIDDKVKVKFSSDDFEKEIVTDAVIIKSQMGEFVAKYIDLNKYDEDRIVKYVFKTISKS